MHELGRRVHLLPSRFWIARSQGKTLAAAAISFTDLDHRREAIPAVVLLHLSSLAVRTTTNEPSLHSGVTARRNNFHHLRSRASCATTSQATSFSSLFQSLLRKNHRRREETTTSSAVFLFPLFQSPPGREQQPPPGFTSTVASLNHKTPTKPSLDCSYLIPVSFAFLSAIIISRNVFPCAPASTTATGHRGLGGSGWWCAKFDVFTWREYKGSFGLLLGVRIM